MKRLLLLSAAALLCFCSCTPAENEDPDDPQEQTGLPDPEITVTGVPSEPVKAWSSFTIKVKSNSSAMLTYSVDKPEVAKLTLSKQRVYSVATGAPEEDTEVTVTFTQKEGMGYAASEVSVKFTVMKAGATEVVFPNEPTGDLEGTKTEYTEIGGDIINPERGLYKAIGDIRDVNDPVEVSTVKAVRLDGKSLVYVGFYPTDFMEGDISQEFLDMMQTSFDAMREGGVKCVLRFAYRNSEDATPWDPTPEVVLRHIEQVKPLLQKNEDVIFVLQAGFVGVWGEWYYTSHFNMNPSKYEDYLPRKSVVDALLDALPTSRQIALRTPAFKMNMYQLSLADTLTVNTAHDGSDMSRLGGHNDCFGADSSDSGTFNGKDDRAFWKAETKYTIMGGETCKVSEYCTCDNTLSDLEKYHWTYLNSGYNGSVLSRWKNTGCWGTITTRLGYRLVLKDSFHNGDPANGPVKVTLRLCNKGYAAPQNPRNANLVFIDANGNRTVTPLESDPRTWHPGWHVIEQDVTIPAVSGTMYLDLSDPLLPERSEYSIALANEGVFDSQNGFNKLFDL